MDNKVSKIMVYAFLLILALFVILYPKKKPSLGYNSTGSYTNHKEDAKDLSEFYNICLDQDDYSYKIYKQTTINKITEEERQKDPFKKDDIFSHLPDTYELLDEGTYELDIEDITFKSKDGKIVKTTIKDGVIHYDIDCQNPKFIKSANQPIAYGEEKKIRFILQFLNIFCTM